MKTPTFQNYTEKPSSAKYTTLWTNKKAYIDTKSNTLTKNDATKDNHQSFPPSLDDNRFLTYITNKLPKKKANQSYQDYKSSTCNSLKQQETTSEQTLAQNSRKQE